MAYWRRGRLPRRFSPFFHDDMILLASRIGIAPVLFLAGQAKVELLMTFQENASDMFRGQYPLRVVYQEFAVHIAAYAEQALPVLLVLGLLTRPIAVVLLCILLGIEFFLRPVAWPTHISWAALLLPLIIRGPGAWSLDRVIGGLNAWYRV